MLLSVLVVDDDPAFRGLAVSTLRSWGHDVVGEAATVAEAKVRVEALRPDAVLLDVGLPDGDGFALTADLCGLPQPPRVVLISSDGDAGYEAAARRAGAGGFVSKVDLTGARMRRLLEAGERR
jgi:CheY-like chemotaxis protein